jgi:4-methylaminobutanoate oxidase (formaldehyde-forming)
MSPPSSAKIVIIGGGIIGCSVAYHLGKMGLTDVLLLERGRLTSGSTWHAAGLVGQLRSSAGITELLGYSVSLYDRLEQETGLATGWKRNGGLRLACNAERWIEVKRQATTATSFGLEMQLLSPEEAQALWPLMQIDDVVGAAFLPTDGQASPTDIAMSLVKGARLRGVTIAEGVKVTSIEVENGRVRAVVTDKGRIGCDKIVICAGLWSREVGRIAGVNIPVVPVQHQYLITERIEGVTSGLPTLRDPDRLTYWKEEVGGLVMGGYEPNPKPWLVDGALPESFEFQLLDNDLDFEPLLQLATGRVPAMQTAGIKRFINGPEASRPTATSSWARHPRCDGIFVGAANAFGSPRRRCRLALSRGVGGQGEPDRGRLTSHRFGRNHLDHGWVRARTLEAYAKHYTIALPVRGISWSAAAPRRSRSAEG